MLMLDMLALTRFDNAKSMSLYLHANGIAATVLSLVSLYKVLSFKLEKIIPAALVVMVMPSPR